MIFRKDQGMRVPQPRLPKIVRPNHPRFVDEAAVSRSKCNERPPTGRAPFLIRASPTPSKYASLRKK
ncbi:hypothetical protein NPIL_651791 [Nephila pilipes]|uniref:Uncharacterized protein n=1 Tax=Nephila pilipes TaxID=299642 RepID=A0A8X6N2L4_NEPPI|nr:hypothetical protein NPIL_651791 [Nephila pilipes]